MIPVRDVFERFVEIVFQQFTEFNRIHLRDLITGICAGGEFIRQLAEQEDAGTEQLFRREGHAVAHDGRDEGLPFADVTVDRCPEICSELSSLCGIERLDVVDISAFQIISRHL